MSKKEVLGKSSLETRAGWSGFEAIAVGVIGTFAWQLLVRLVVGPAASHSLSLEAVARIIAGLGSIGLCYLVARSHQRSWKSLGLRWPQPRAWKDIVPVWAVYFACSFLLSLVVFTMLSVLVPSLELDKVQNLGIPAPHGLGMLAIVYLLVVILPAVFEEIVYRGFIFGGIRTQLNFWPAAIISSLLFGAAHLQLNVALDTFVLGVALCWLYERYQSVVPTIAVHLLKNTIAFSLIYVF